MALLDWMKERSAPRQDAAQGPETAKEMYSRQAAEQPANKALEQMPPDQKAKVDAIKERLEKATQHIDKNAHSPSTAPTDSIGNREAMRQNMTGQDKTAHALSPTDYRTGRAAEGNAPEQSSKSPAKAPENSTSRPQTLPRPRPSWER
jgi:hypothetical protein